MTVSGATDCQMPDFLISKPKWETQIRDEKRSTGMYVKFTATSITVTDFEGVRPTQKLYDIQKCFGSHKYLTKLKNENQYVCFAIEEKSYYILKWSMSESTNHMADDICNDENLASSKWPLIWSHYEKTHYQTCPLIGGFNMKIYDNDREKHLCDNYWLSPRLDSECMTGEGMSLEFRHFECMGKLGMKMKQALVCLGSWEEGGYSYTVLSNGDRLWPKLWLMRVSSTFNRQQEFNVNVYQDIQEHTVDETDTGRKFYTLTLTEKVIESVCEDEGNEVMCNVDNTEECNDLQQMYCKKSCGMCDTEVETCAFDETFEGTWETVESNAKKTQVTVGDMYTVSTKTEVVQFKCMNTSYNKQLQTRNMYPMVASFDNGCKPRYSCLEMVARSQSVMSSRMSQNTVWPDSTEVRVMCSEDNFEDNLELTGNSMATKYPHAMVKTELEKGEGRTGHCDIRFQKYHLKSDSAENSWTIITVMNNTLIRNNTCSMDETDEINTAHGIMNDWQCLAYYHEGSTEFVVVESLSSQMFPRSQCWILYKNERSATKKLLVVYPYDCNDAAIRYHANNRLILLSDYSFTNEQDSELHCEVTSSYTTASIEPDEFLHLTTDVASGEMDDKSSYTTSWHTHTVVQTQYEITQRVDTTDSQDELLASEQFSIWHSTTSMNSKNEPGSDETTEQDRDQKMTGETVTGTLFPIVYTTLTKPSQNTPEIEENHLTTGGASDRFTATEKNRNKPGTSDSDQKEPDMPLVTQHVPPTDNNTDMYNLTKPVKPLTSGAVKVRGFSTFWGLVIAAICTGHFTV